MKAAWRTKYGQPSKVLSIREVDKPTPKDNEVLVKVHAATANRTDHYILIGQMIMRPFTGLFKPKKFFLGSDFAGQVEATGAAVSSFKVGDKVMGFDMFLNGSLAEYLVFSESKGIVSMPVNMDYEQAAACVEATFYAASGIIQLKPKAGQKALVYGATGAIGSADVQFLKYFGVYVTAVCAGEHADLVRSLGADKIIDYKTQDFTKDQEQYDFVVDAVGKAGFFQSKRLLKKKGMYLPSDGVGNIFLVPLTKLSGGKRVMFNAPRNIKGTLNFIKELVEKGSFRPLIDRTYPLDKIAEAFTYVGTKQKIGNVIIKIEV
jgi:NADPH:quinone reductase-like Zn-dependent oxidoreductase